MGTGRLYRGPEGFAIFPDLLIRARLAPDALEAYLDSVLQSGSARRYFQQKAQGTSGNMPKVDQTTISHLPVPLPPLAEQRRIAGTVERQLAAIERVAAAAAMNLKRAEAMREAVLAKAFRGELV